MSENAPQECRCARRWGAPTITCPSTGASNGSILRTVSLTRTLSALAAWRVVDEGDIYRCASCSKIYCDLHDCIFRCTNGKPRCESCAVDSYKKNYSKYCFPACAEVVRRCELCCISVCDFRKEVAFSCDTCERLACIECLPISPGKGPAGPSVCSDCLPPLAYALELVVRSHATPLPVDVVRQIVVRPPFPRPPISKGMATWDAWMKYGLRNALRYGRA